MVKRFLEAIYKMCIDYPLQSKVVFVPNLGIAQEILHALAKEGYRALNLQVVPISAFVKERAGSFLSEQKLQFVEIPFLEQILWEVLKTLKQQGKFTYFKKLPITFELSKEIYCNLIDLKMAGITGESLLTEKFVDRTKGKDLALILDGYNQALQNR